MWEILIVIAIAIIVCIVNGIFDTKKFFNDNSVYIKSLKEDDYDFLVHVKYGEAVNPDILFNKRIKNGVMVFGIALVFSAVTYGLNFLAVLVCAIVAVFIFKSGYSSLKSYYKARLHDIDLLLPYYLKMLEVLIQYYTVPVAISRSIEDAPEIFRPGLRKLIVKIENGDSSIDPYMDFAKEYPVRDSMRMMRLLYRLGLGIQDNKEEQLLLLSKTISSLQNKAREQKYKERLEKMQSKTMIMLFGTGAGVIVLLLVAMMMMMDTM